MKDEMPAASPTDAALVRYLLGASPRAEEERLDELSVVDAEFSERLQSVEHDLADAYVRGELSEADRSLWERRYLGSASGREQHELARALAARGEAQAVSRRFPSRWVGYAAAAAVIVAVAGGIVMVRRRVEAPSPRVTASAPPGEAVTSAPTPAPPGTSVAAERRFIALTLAPSTRSVTPMPTLAIPRGTGDVRLTLRLEPDGFSRYDVTVRNPATNEIIWSADDIDAARTADSRDVVITIPADRFRAARYLIVLRGVAPRTPEVVETYSLQVVLQ